MIEENIKNLKIPLAGDLNRLLMGFLDFLMMNMLIQNL